ncbi:DUF3768 domain-containing protein [Desulforhopalus singaporensis]|uniref:DUF3768 domain-containing protein n=1 Tax=Desulforhopalus singaporensis TaxID=91360 RepID=A0A1H0PKF2_9BACT|nr:DUF3768 domain-containing protein [Desulforhopalus singaporensis]SDP05474.1 Protein of unknown function [Desulforhopalus singaporensis]
MSQTTATIRELNDSFRKSGAGGKILITDGVGNLEEAMIYQILITVFDYDDFTESNDPYGEHDFGNFKIGGETIFWKIDYYDNDFKFGSENPANPEITERVLTIMLAEEY